MARTTGKVTYKLYRCAHCETEHKVSTNHFGEVYSRCPNPNCVSRRPVVNATHKPPRHVCLEPLPEGWDRPTPWKIVRLGDIADVV